MRLRIADCGLRFGGLLALLLLPRGAVAQVGHDPERSPYHDLRAKQSASIIGGFVRGQRGHPGVAPGEGPIVGIRYDRQVGTAADIIIAISGARLDRYDIISSLPEATRKSGPFTENLLFMETGVSLILTWRKSWHGFVPYVGAMLGVVFETGLSLNEFQFGTRGHVAPHIGFKWFPVQALAFKVEAGDIIWRVRYPDNWFVAQAANVPAVLTVNTDQSAEWLHHPTVTLSLGYTFTF